MRVFMGVLVGILALALGLGLAPAIAADPCPCFGRDLEDGFAWKKVPGNPDAQWLYQGGRVRGHYCLKTHKFRWIVEGAVRGDAVEPPIAAPVTGVVVSRHGPQVGFTVSGEPVDRQTALQAIQAAAPTDQGKGRISVFSCDRKQGLKVESEILSAPAFADFKDQWIVRHYLPEDLGGKAGPLCSKEVSISVQGPDGREIHRQNHYQGGADAFCKALREAVAKYDPIRTADFTLPWYSRIFVGDQLQTTGLVAGGTAAFLGGCYYLRRRRLAS